jgi:hypothetical protein
LHASLAERAAALLANHENDLARAKAGLIEYRDIGTYKLGLREPTWTEWAWAKATGQPITWRERVRHIVKLAKRGVHLQDARATYLKNRAVHGTQEVGHKLQDATDHAVHSVHAAAHQLQDAANRAADKIKYRADL